MDEGRAAAALLDVPGTDDEAMEPMLDRCVFDTPAVEVGGVGKPVGIDDEVEAIRESELALGIELCGFTEVE